MNFNDVLNTPLSTVKRPPLPPLGSYRFVISKWEKADAKSDKGEWENIIFTNRAISPGPDVDIEALRDWGDPKNIVVQHNFMFDKNNAISFQNTLVRLTTFLTKHCGLGDEMELKEALGKCVNRSFMAALGLRPDKNNTGEFFVEIKSTAAVE